jgi:Trypsin-like serine proteases, typically periplasmic, contain C-terminal PDZ domain
MRLLYAGVLALVIQCGLLAGASSAASPSAETNDQLKARIERLKAVLAGDVCTDPAARALLSLSSGAGGAPDAAGTAPSSPPRSAGKGAPAAALSRGQLVEALNKAVVLVIAARDTGSGFFITPDLVVTNNHVVTTAVNREVAVVGGGTGGVRKARIIDQTARQDGRDYAILRVEGFSNDHFLALSDTAGELTRVVAAGYPGLLLDNDMNFRALLRGDVEALPDLALSQGAVMALQNRDRGLMTIAHSAPISGGNSGGPLVDTCGRVLGVNTFINVSVQQATSAGFALSSRDLLAYLSAKGIVPTRRDEPCQE